MTAENLVRLLQMTGAALAIPAAAAGTFAAYQGYFSSDVTCQKLRRLHDLRCFIAAPRHHLVREDDAAGLVGTPGRNERSDQAAEQAADGRVRARALDRGGTGRLWAEVAPASCS
jgi:hypothetical protein